jgi:hypothetical protein
MTQMSTGLSRTERRNAAIPSGGGALVIYSYAEAAAIIGISKRTLERMLANGTGPQVTQLSQRRFGITAPDMREWQRNRPRKARPASTTTETHA